MSKLPVREPPAQKKSPVLQFVQDWLPITAVLVGALWTLYDYSTKRVEAEKAAEATRRIEAQRPFLIKKLDLYFETAQTTGRLQNLKPGTDDWTKETARFWALRWSEMEMVGNPRIREAMRLVGERIAQIEAADNKTTRHGLRWMTECLADELRFSLEESWGNAVAWEFGPFKGSASAGGLPSGCYAGTAPPKLSLPTAGDKAASR